MAERPINSMSNRTIVTDASAFRCVVMMDQPPSLRELRQLGIDTAIRKDMYGFPILSVWCFLLVELARLSRATLCSRIWTLAVHLTPAILNLTPADPSR